LRFNPGAEECETPKSISASHCLRKRRETYFISLYAGSALWSKIIASVGDFFFQNVLLEKEENPLSEIN
jgi:hypothetical protein